VIEILYFYIFIFPLSVEDIYETTNESLKTSIRQTLQT